MSPITEDQVVELMNGCARREKEARIASREATAGDTVVRFDRAADIVTLDHHRARTRVRRTVSGMFFYVGGRSVRL